VNDFHDERFSRLQRVWLLRGATYCVVGFFILIGVVVFANWQAYLLVGLGGLSIGGAWLWWAYSANNEDRERRRGNASPEAAKQGLDVAGWEKRSDQ
jgi:hypothetical protein